MKNAVLPTLEEAMARYTTACDLKQSTDRKANVVGSGMPTNGSLPDRVRR
jgi:hypothetical protein